MSNKNSEDIDPHRVVTLEKQGWIAIIRLNRPDRFNCLTRSCLALLASILNDVAAMDEITVTVITGTGRFFSAGGDIAESWPVGVPGADSRRYWTQTYVGMCVYSTHALYTHPKILVAALNGPAIGAGAVMIAHADFVYAAPHTFIQTPYSSIGLCAEGGSSRTFVQKLGANKANEALLMGKPIRVKELQDVGFVTKIFEAKDFFDQVMTEIRHRFDPKILNHASLLGIKWSLRKPEMATMDAVTVTEVLSSLDRFVEGVPQRGFARLARREKDHKL